MILRAFLAIAILAALAGPPVSAQEAHYDTPIEKELYEWVFFPCMSVRLSLALPSLEEDGDFVQNPRDAMVGVLAGLDTRDAAKRAEASLKGKPWSIRRQAYPLLLRQCLKEFAGLE